MRDPGQNDRGPALDLIGRESEDHDPFLREPCCSSRVITCGVLMDRSVDFNAELGCGTIEVEDERADRMLSPEVQPKLVAPQQRP